MYEFLKNLAESNNWVFEYSRSDYQNLFQGMSASTVHLFVDPIVIDSTFSETGMENQTASGKMMLLMSSDIDEDYSTKYQNYIKPLIDEALQVLKDDIRCSEHTINRFQATEVINLFDFNLDGLIITYGISMNQ